MVSSAAPSFRGSRTKESQRNNYESPRENVGTDKLFFKAPNYSQVFTSLEAFVTIGAGISAPCDTDDVTNL